MRKLFSLIAAVLFAGSMMADPIVINASDVTTIASGATSGLDVTLQGINIVWQGAYYNSDGGDGGSASVDFRVYANKSMTLTAESNISKVEIAGYCKAGLTVTANAGTITTGASYASETTKGTLEDPLIVVDEIGATSVTLTCTKQVRAYTLRITLEGDVPPVVADIYTVAGNDAAIFGEAWNPALEANDMKKVGGIYTWEKAELNLTAGTIEFKVVKNHSWDIAYPAQNYALNIAEDGEYTITITFDPATETVAAEAVKNEPLADPTNCAEAAEAALSVSKNNELYNDGKEYTIEGYVTSIAAAYSDSYHNISFWMADTQDGGNVLQAYRAACESAEAAPGIGDKVAVTGKLTKYNSTPEFAQGCTFEIIEKSTVVPQNLGEKTIAEFLELKNSVDTCILTGTVANVKNTEYGNFDLVELGNAEVSVYVYGLLTAAGEAKKCFAEENIAEGDTLKVLAIYGEYNAAPQVKNAIFVEVKHLPVIADTIVIDIEEEVQYTDQVANQGWWQFLAENEDYEISISNVSTTQAAGVYGIEDLDADYTYVTVKATETDVYFVDGEFTLTEGEDGSRTIVGLMTGDDGNIYDIKLVYSIPTAKTTVNVEIPEWGVANASEFFGFEGYVFYGEAEDGTYVQITIPGSNPLGQFTYEDCYAGGTGIEVDGEFKSIYSMDLNVSVVDEKVVIIADILCLNNTLYHVTTAGALQGVNNVEAAQKAIKSIMNGQLVIEKNGKTFNAAGQMLK